MNDPYRTNAPPEKEMPKLTRQADWSSEGIGLRWCEQSKRVELTIKGPGPDGWKSLRTEEARQLADMLVTACDEAESGR